MLTTAASAGATDERGRPADVAEPSASRGRFFLELHLDAGQCGAEPRDRAGAPLLASRAPRLGAGGRTLVGAAVRVQGIVGSLLVLHWTALAADPLWGISGGGALAGRSPVRGRARGGRAPAEWSRQAQGADRALADRRPAAAGGAAAARRVCGPRLCADHAVGRAHAHCGARR